MSAVLFEHQPNGVFVATLNSEKSLNSLTLEMIELLGPALERAARDPDVALVVLQGAGPKAFCAGGDIRKLYESMIEAKNPRENAYAAKFFEAEYRLDYQIHTFPKPLLCWGHGIVMGGGLGLFAGASARVVTEASKVAMPEITIGLYPDVGASYFLNRMPEGVGAYLALTGTRMNADDVLYVGLADFFISSDRKDAVFERLFNEDWASTSEENQEQLEEILGEFQAPSLAHKVQGEIERHLPFIRESIGSASGELGPDPVESIAHFWRGYESDEKYSDKWIRSGIETFFRGSPTAAKVMFEQLRRAKDWDLKQVFVSEGDLTVQFAWHHDFREGIRALLIDKDNQPRWQPGQLKDVDARLVAEHFESPWADGKSPLLKLPEPARRPF